jgi:hypothetical protein
LCQTDLVVGTNARYSPARRRTSPSARNCRTGPARFSVSVVSASASRQGTAVASFGVSVGTLFCVCVWFSVVCR